MSKAVLFSTSTCSWCRRAKRCFTEHRVPFKEIDVERDPKAARDIARKTGQTGVPVIKIGNRWIVGFDKERIEKELQLRHNAVGVRATLTHGRLLEAHLLLAVGKQGAEP